MRIRIVIVLATLAGFSVASCITTPRGSGLFVPRLTTNSAGSLITVYDVNPGFTNTLGNVQQVTQGTPWSLVSQTILGGIAGVCAFIAKRKSDQAAVVPALMAGLDKATNAEEVETAMHLRASERGINKQLSRTIRLHKHGQAREHFGR